MDHQIPKNCVPNLGKACEVLQIVVAHPEGISLADISERLDIPRTTAFRILNTLCVHNFLQKKNTHYVSGFELLRLGIVSTSNLKIRDVIRPYLKSLANQSKETAHVALLSGTKVLILDVCESPQPIRAASRAGFLAELHASATGKVFLAAMTHEELDEIKPQLSFTSLTRNTHTTWKSLEANLHQVRQLGYAVDEEEYYEGVRCLAMPVFGSEGKVIAAMGITGSTQRLTLKSVPDMLILIKSIVTELSRSMGYFGG